MLCVKDSVIRSVQMHFSLETHLDENVNEYQQTL